MLLPISYDTEVLGGGHRYSALCKGAEADAVHIEGRLEAHFLQSASFQRRWEIMFSHANAAKRGNREVGVQQEVFRSPNYDIGERSCVTMKKAG